jgi:hypothetical protein
MPKDHHLIYAQRCQIYILMDRGASPSSIARALNIRLLSKFIEPTPNCIVV